MTEKTESTDPDLGAVFDAHVKHEFVDKDVDATMSTMTEDPYVHHVAMATGGVGRQGVHDFYKKLFRRKVAGRCESDPDLTNGWQGCCD
jgi:hypothetical protein